MGAVIRKLVGKARRLSGNGAVHNARLEVDHATRSVVDLDRQLRSVADTKPRRAA
jgi:hypothetical protein